MVIACVHPHAGWEERDMIEFNYIYDTISALLPFEVMQMRFMQQALLGLVLLSPMVSLLGVQVVNSRMAFLADAISHSAFTGVALGLVFIISPKITMPLFGVLVGLAIVLGQRKSTLTSDTVIGVFFSGVVAFGLAVVSRDKNTARNIQQVLYGDILTIGNDDIYAIFALLAVLTLFQIIGFNRMLYLSINPTLAKVHGVQVAFYQYTYAGFLALVVIFSVWAVGVLLVTAMMIVPAAAARNFSNSAGSMVWWALLISCSSCIIGLLISAQEWARTATGATIIIVAFIWFLISLGVNYIGSIRFNQ